MVYLFDDFRLDTDLAVLTKGADEVPLEPRIFELLVLLLDHRDRVLTKDDLVEKIWEGRFISDSAISTAVKALRQALGDDGVAQRYIRTVRGRGFRFVGTLSAAPQPAADVPTNAPAALESPPATSVVAPQLPESESSVALDPAAGGKPSIMVLPFQCFGGETADNILADAVPHELIQTLSRMRWLTIIARGTAFRFRDPDPDLADIRARLHVRYVLAGSIAVFGNTRILTVELADSGTSEVLWGDRMEVALDDVAGVRERLMTAVVAALELYIPMNEARNARLGTTENLDAWANYHLGLNHMYRYTIADTEKARVFFEQAIAQDPSFARAHAGHSFVRFQDAFINRTADITSAIRDSRASADRSIELDPVDPFSNFSMGRAFWIGGDLETGKSWFERSITLSPNYAQGHYCLGLVDALLGNSQAAGESLDTACLLSPLDPLRYGMLASRAIAYLGNGEIEAACKIAEEASGTPGAHYLIHMIAVLTQGLMGNHEIAQKKALAVKAQKPDANQEQFFRSLPVIQPALRAQMEACFRKYGF
ncbi:MAG: winged helix-turn-helix domain-containing protein [Magnetospiraceae bacterium]